MRGLLAEAEAYGASLAVIADGPSGGTAEEGLPWDGASAASVGAPEHAMPHQEAHSETASVPGRGSGTSSREPEPEVEKTLPSTALTAAEKLGCLQAKAAPASPGGECARSSGVIPGAREAGQSSILTARSISCV